MVETQLCKLRGTSALETRRRLVLKSPFEEYAASKALGILIRVMSDEFCFLQPLNVLRLSLIHI